MMPVSLTITTAVLLLLHVIGNAVEFGITFVNSWCCQHPRWAAKNRDFSVNLLGQEVSRSICLSFGWDEWHGGLLSLSRAVIITVKLDSHWNFSHFYYFVDNPSQKWYYLGS